MPVLSDAQIAAALRAGGFPADQIATGVAIALAESGGKTDALNTANRNGTWDAGLMQVNSIHGHSQQQLFNVQYNVSAALKIFQAAGNKWRPWSTYNSGSYRRFLPRGTIAAGAPANPGAPVVVPVGNGSGPVSVPDDQSFWGKIMDPTTWQRIGLFMLGGILCLIGLYQMTGIGETIIKTAKNVAIVRGLT